MTGLERNIYEEMASRMESLSELSEQKPGNDFEYQALSLRKSMDEAAIKSLRMIMEYSDTAENIDMAYTFSAIRRYAEAYDISLRDAIRYIDSHNMNVEEIEESILEQNSEMFFDEDGCYDRQKLQDYIVSMERSA